ncbi:hypothetical protein FE633_19695 [Streptomyces montanus]|uniref:DNA primase n=1 Tax=Streptomyces montanus TaxID=2580423 RepID=A0A5R9FRN7_9ACTN|nr:hypothetical protein [Streptomyces montanus]TLS44530.1 hypothetical protein FE633_19695 [Streptomyces montanus]
MNGQVGLAFASGYLMGRNHRMRLALTLAGVAAGKRLVSGQAPAGLGQVKSSELGKITHEVRSQLVSAGRTAAVSAASQRIDALSDRLEARATSLRAVPGADGEQKAEEEPDEKASQKAAPEKGKAERDKAQGEKAQGDKARDEEGEGRTKKPRAEARKAARSRTAPQKKSSDRPAAARKKTAAGGSARRSRG